MIKIVFLGFIILFMGCSNKDGHDENKPIDEDGYNRCTVEVTLSWEKNLTQQNKDRIMELYGRNLTKNGPPIYSAHYEENKIFFYVGYERGYCPKDEEKNKYHLVDKHLNANLKPVSGSPEYKIEKRVIGHSPLSPTWRP